MLHRFIERSTRNPIVAYQRDQFLDVPASISVTCEAQCYTPGVATLASHTEVMAAGNILFGGVVGLGIDAASGAMNTYDAMWMST